MDRITAFALCNALARTFPLDRAYFDDIYKLLWSANGSGFLFEKINGSFALTSQAVFNHIFWRTVPFKKTFEDICIRDIVNGMPSIMLAPSPISQRSVERAYAVLRNEKLMLQVRVPGSSRYLRCLYYPAIVNVLHAALSEHTIRLTVGKRAVNVIPRLLRWNDAVANYLDGVVMCVQRFGPDIKDITEAVTSMSHGLLDVERIAAEKSREAVKKQIGKKTAVPSGQEPANPGAWILSLWEEALMMNDDKRYQNAIVRKGVKDQAMAKRYYKDMRSAGHEIDFIKRRIREVIKLWRFIGHTRIRAEDGYNRLIPVVPEFPFYYRNTAQINAALTDEARARKR